MATTTPQATAGPATASAKAAADTPPPTLAEEYSINGFLAARAAFGAERVADTRKRFDALEAEVGLEASAYSLHNRHADLRWVYDLVTAPELLDTVEQLLGPNIMLLDSRFICKHGLTPEEVARGDKNPRFVAWHQDITYWPLEPPEVTTVWVAVDDADVGNGCMKIIPGTHKAGVFKHGVAVRPGNLLSVNQEIEDVDAVCEGGASNAIPCPVPAGSFSVHEGHTVHCSPPNDSTRRRCGLVLRYVSTSVRPVEDPKRPRRFPCVTLVRGVDDTGNFTTIPAPALVGEAAASDEEGGSAASPTAVASDDEALPVASSGAGAGAGAGAGVTQMA